MNKKINIKEMPPPRSRNYFCAIPNCSGRSGKIVKNGQNEEKLSVFRMPTGMVVKGRDTTKWREDFIKFIYQYRNRFDSRDMISKHIKNNNVFICSQHYNYDDIWHNICRPCLKHGVLPSQKLPIKSLDKSLTKVDPRREIIMAGTEPRYLYKKCNDIIKYFSALKTKNLWSVIPTQESNSVILGKFITPDFPKFVLTIIFENNIPNINLKLYGTTVPPSFVPSFLDQTIYGMLQKIDEIERCVGFTKVPDLKR